MKEDSQVFVLNRSVELQQLMEKYVDRSSFEGKISSAAFGHFQFNMSLSVSCKYMSKELEVQVWKLKQKM